MLCVAALSIFSLSMYAQKEIIKVTPDYKIGQSGFGTVGNLNAAIATVAANQGCGNVIFELERDAFYYSINEIRPDQQNLHLRAVAGTGRRPMIMAAANPVDGKFYQIFMNFTGNLTLEGIHILGTTTEGSQLDQALRTAAVNLRVIVNDCIIERNRDRVLRMNNAGTKAYFRNTIIRNLGQQTGGGNGVRVNTYCDSLVVQNCTFYNMNETVFSNMSNGLNYFEVSNCTFMNTGFASSTGIDVGRSKVALIADNVFYNVAFRRNSSYHNPFFIASNMQGSSLPFKDVDRDIKIINNNWYVDDAVAKIYDDNYSQARDTLSRTITVIAGNDTTTKVVPFKYIVGNVWLMDETLDSLYDGTPVLVALKDSGVVTLSNNFKEKLTFNKPPAYPVLYVSSLIKSNWSNSIFANMELTSDTMYWVTENPATPYDLSYNQNAISATAGRNGRKIGAYKDWVTVGISNSIANENKLSVYPNPTSSVLHIDTDYKALEIFNITGNLMYQSVDNSNRILHVSNFKPGIYIISVRDLNDNKLVGKFVKR